VAPGTAAQLKVGAVERPVAPLLGDSNITRAGTAAKATLGATYSKNTIENIRTSMLIHAGSNLLRITFSTTIVHTTFTLLNLLYRLQPLTA